MSTAYAPASLAQQTGIQSFLERYGDFSLSFHTLQPQLSHFVTDKGYLAYIKFRNETIVLGDPVTEKNDFQFIVESFLENNRHCSFIQSGEIVADILRDKKFSVNLFGVESKLPLPFSIAGKQKREIRNLYNAAQRSGIKVLEMQNRSEIFENSVQTNSNQNFFQQLLTSQNEYSFLSRSFRKENEKDVRIFAGFLDNKMICYSLFDPVYEDSRIIGYAESIARQTTKCIKGARTFTLLQAMQQFSTENKQFVNLGLHPFYYDDIYGKYSKYESKTIKRLFSFLYESSPMISNFKGLSFHKSRYRGEYIPRYFISNSKHKLKALYSIYQLTTGIKLPFFL